MPISTATIARKRGLKESAVHDVQAERVQARFRRCWVSRSGRNTKAAIDDQDRRERRGDEEATIDRCHAGAVAGPRRDREDAHDSGDDADRRHDQREHQAQGAEGGRAQDQGRDQGHGVGLEEVGRHARAVADVVADVVGDGRGVARVVLGDLGLDLADQVGADVGGLGEDAAADTHEHRQQRCTEAEALEDRGRLALVDQHDDRSTEQAQARR